MGSRLGPIGSCCLLCNVSSVGPVFLSSELHGWVDRRGCRLRIHLVSVFRVKTHSRLPVRYSKVGRTPVHQAYRTTILRERPPLPQETKHLRGSTDTSRSTRDVCYRPNIRGSALCFVYKCLTSEILKYATEGGPISLFENIGPLPLRRARSVCFPKNMTTPRELFK